MTESREVSTGPAVSSPESAVRTFLIADVRGYTRFTVEHGDEAGARLSGRFAELAAEVFGDQPELPLELRGDEVMAVFVSARSALHSAIQLQQRLALEMEHDSSLPLRVGVGLDAGDAVRVGQGYRGGALNLAARLCSLAGPGEVFASEGVVHLARKTEGLAFLDRGHVQLKGLPDPVHVIQVVPDGTAPPSVERFTVHVTRASNLPVQLTAFVGREAEVDAITSTVRGGARLVTLTGAGGTGKTRLSLQVATGLVDQYADGVFFVSLASITDPSLIVSAIASALDVSETSDRSLLTSVKDALRDAHTLLVLDNFEHLLEGAPVVAELLSEAPQLQVLATSRAPLHLTAEREFPVPPLPVPDPAHMPPVDTVSRFDSVALFADRARAVKPDFTIDTSTAPAVAEICYRLDGLPLAIELAAARIRLFPPQALLSRLSRRLALLTGGARDAPARQQTLRQTIEWSYDLLSSPEQTIFAQLAAFAGGCTVEAAEAVCRDGVELLDGVESLIEKSLLRQEGHEEPRFVMLETIREYAAEKLELGGLSSEVRKRHLEYMVSLAEQAEAGIRGADQAVWFARLEAEQSNFRAAIEWAMAGGEVELGLRIASGLWRFWWAHGHLTEGRRWFETLFSHAGDGVTPEIRARALNGMANLSWALGDLDRAEELHREALILRESLNDSLGVALSLNNLGIVTEQRGDFEEAAGWYERGLEAARRSGDGWTIALLVSNLGGVLGSLNRWERARDLAEEALDLWRRLGDRFSEARVLNNLMSIAFASGAYDRAAELQRQSLSLCLDLGAQENVPFCLEGTAKILGAMNRPLEATRLWGAADALRGELHQPLPPSDLSERAEFLDRARRDLDPESFQESWREGRGWSMADAASYALRSLQPE